MNMRRLYVMSICYMPMMHAYLYQAVVLKKWDDVCDRYQYVIGLGDYHAKRHPANRVQREQLGELLAHTDGDELKVLTEDLSAANSDGRFGCGPFYVNASGGFLSGITEQCRAYGIDTDNLEFRYARVCALGPVLNNEHKMYSYPSVCSISVGQVCDEIYQECACIEQFDDGQAAVNDWYTASIRDVMQYADKLALDKHRRKSMADYLSRKRKRLPLVKDLLTFDRCLLDARIVHAILECQDKERICVIAGGSHIERVSDLLQKIGYQPLIHIKPLYYKGNGIQNAVSLPMEDQPSSLPKPLDMHRLRDFF